MQAPPGIPLSMPQGQPQQPSCRKRPHTLQPDKPHPHPPGSVQAQPMAFTGVSPPPARDLSHPCIPGTLRRPTWGILGYLTIWMANALVLVEEEGASRRAGLEKLSRKRLPRLPRSFQALGCTARARPAYPPGLRQHTSEPPRRLILAPGTPPIIQVPPEPWPGIGTPPLPPRPQALPHHRPWASGLERAC